MAAGSCHPGHIQGYMQSSDKRNFFFFYFFFKNFGSNCARQKAAFCPLTLSL